MKRFPSSRLLVTAVAFLLITVLCSQSAHAQLQTGNIYGKVQAKDGAVLPGVTVTLTGIGAPQTFVSDGEGSFRFLSLSPGAYSIGAELTGFGKSTRNGIQVSVGQNAEVTMTMNPSANDAITVTADAPLIDTRRTGTGQVTTLMELEQIPSGRDPWVIMGQAPGVQLDRINVGGSEGGQQDVIVAKGASDTQKTFNLDGVNITDVGAIGSTPTYFDFDSFEEIQVTTGGSDPRIQTPGAQLNMVTKRGTNDFKGSLRYFLTDRQWQASADAPTEARHYEVSPIIDGNQTNKLDNYSGDMGGPIWKDKVWFWGSYAKQDLKLFILRSKVQDENGEYTITPAQTRDDTILKNWNGKLSAQFLPSNNATYLYTYGNKLKFGRGASATHASPETTLDQTGPTHMYKFEDTQIFGQSLYLTALYSHVSSPFTFTPEGGQTQPFIDETGLWHRSYYYYSTTRPQDSTRLDGSYFAHTGRLDHELKFGFGYRKTPVTSSSIYPATGALGDLSQGNNEDCPGCGLALLTRPGGVDYKVKYNDYYVGDTITTGSLTVQAGLRMDRQQSRTAGFTSAANPLAPDVLKAVTYAGDPQSLHWNSVSPRLGLTYTLGGAKKTLLRGSYNQYVDQLGGGGLVAGGNPLLYANGVYYYWKDTNNDQFVQRNEILFDLGPYSGYYLGDIEHPNDVGASSRIDYGMKVPRTHELIFGAEQQVMSDLSVGVDLSYRRFNNFWWAANEKTAGAGDYYTSADYVQVGTLTGTLPNGKSYSVPNYALRPDLSFSGLSVITTRPDYYQTYRGLDLYLTKRLTNKWMSKASFSFNNRTQHVGGNGIQDPTQVLSSAGNQFGCTSCDGAVAVDHSYGTHSNTYLNAKWQYNVVALYQLPWRVTISGNLTGRQGYPIPYYLRINNDDGTGSKNVLVDGIDGQRLKATRELDLRLAKDFTFSGLTTTVAIEGFNVMDQRNFLSRNPRLNQSTGAQITELQSPRIFRVSGKLSF